MFLVVSVFLSIIKLSLSPVYTIQPVVKPVVNRLYRVNGLLGLIMLNSIQTFKKQVFETYFVVEILLMLRRVPTTMMLGLMPI